MRNITQIQESLKKLEQVKKNIKSTLPSHEATEFRSIINFMNQEAYKKHLIIKSMRIDKFNKTEWIFLASFESMLHAMQTIEEESGYFLCNELYIKKINLFSNLLEVRMICKNNEQKN